MAANTTIYMTPEESVRVQTTVQNLMQKRQDLKDEPWEPHDPKSLIQEATSASLMQDLSFAAFGLGQTQKRDQETIVAYGVGASYLPSMAKLEDLVPMKMSDLRMETHHRGKLLFLRRVSPVVELKSSSWAVVQGDTPDDVNRLEVFLHTFLNGSDFLNLGFEFLVKEPYYTLNDQGRRVIHIDHPSDLVISAYSDDPESWRRRDKGDTPQNGQTAMECKDFGNDALHKQDNARALAYYTEGLELAKKQGDNVLFLKRDLYRNRSHVNLLLQRYDDAKADALASLTNDKDKDQKTLDAKAYFRAGTAAYALADFEEAKGFFEKQRKLQPASRTSKVYLDKINLRQQEMASGKYDMERAARSLANTNGRLDAASFIRRAKVKSSSRAGRGLFATEEIEPNEVIMCEKAFCVVWSYENEAFSTLICDVRDNAAIRIFPAGLHKAVVQKLMKNPSQIEKVLDLFGDYKGLGGKRHERDGTPVVDTFQIHDIIQRNAFGPGQQSNDEDYSNASTGLWVRASYMNHSCVGNAKKSFVGDLMIIRATRKILAGEEITHSYDETSDYATRREVLYRSWGFYCNCQLCIAEGQDSLALRKKRLELEVEANDFIQRTRAAEAGIVSVNRAKRLHQYIRKTYDEKRYKGLPRRALSGVERWLQEAGLE